MSVFSGPQIWFNVTVEFILEGAALIFPALGAADGLLSAPAS
jgi:hypothetical protein